MMRGIAVFLTLLLIIGVVFGGYMFLRGGRGSTEESTEYTQLRLVSEGDLQPVEYIDVVEGQVYFSIDYIKECIDPEVFYDESDQSIVFTNDQNVRRYYIDDLNGTANDVEINLRAPITIYDNGHVMIPLEAFAYDYPVEFRYIQDDDLVLMDRTDREYMTGEITADTVWIREEGRLDAPIVRTLNTGDQVILYGENKDFLKIRQKDGRAGWVEKKNIQYEYNFEDFYRNKPEEDIGKKEKINMTWDYTSVKEQGVEGLKTPTGVNVMSPTWFSVGEEGVIQDRVNIDYKQFYNNNNVQVWPMVDNLYDSEHTHEILKTSKSRGQIIKDLIAKVDYYDLEGINIDFENLKLDTREYYTQFIKELYPYCKSRGVVLSVDVIPRISSDVTQEQYDRRSLADHSDYICLMAYDQHWASSPTAGSVAEYSWVEANANVLFKDIPMDKFILGMPLYTRIWHDKDGEVTSQSVSMDLANNFITNNNIELEWDDKIKQNVGHKDLGTETVSVWLEDGQSIREKTSLCTKYDMAGVASWRVGFETSNIWKIINDNI